MVSRNELRLLALSYRNIDWLLNLRSRSKSTLKTARRGSVSERNQKSR
nr:MAG TPA: hypothetical protein [Caudoviricetes sp.]